MHLCVFGKHLNFSPCLLKCVGSSATAQGPSWVRRLLLSCYVLRASQLTWCLSSLSWKYPRELGRLISFPLQAALGSAAKRESSDPLWGAAGWAHPPVLAPLLMAVGDCWFQCLFSWECVCVISFFTHSLTKPPPAGFLKHVGLRKAFLIA